MKAVSPVIAFVVFLTLWEVAARLFNIPVYVLPAPSMIFHELLSFGIHFLGHAGATLQTILLGFLVSVLIAIPLGAVIASYRPFSDAVFPLIVFAHAIPVIALAPIIVL